MLSLLWAGCQSDLTAADKYWDINGTAAGAGGTQPSGNWSGANWGSATGTGATAGWVAGNTAVFSAGTDATESFTVTLDVPVTLAGITRLRGTPSIVGSAANPLTFSGDNLAVNSGDGSLTLNAFFAPAAGIITKTGTGILSSEASQTSFDGKWIVNEGSLSLASDLSLGIVPASAKEQVVLNGGKLRTSVPDVSFHLRRKIYLGDSGGGFDQTGTITWNGWITGLGSLTQSGTGTTILAGANTYSGATIVSAGTLSLGAPNVIPDTSSVTIGSTGTLNVNGQAEGIASLSAVGGNLNLGNGTLNILTPNGETCSAAISGSGRIVKRTTASWTIDGDSGANWGMTISDGTLYVGGDTSLGTGKLVFTKGRLAAKGSAARTWPVPVDVLPNDVTFGDPANTGTMTFNNGPWTIDGSAGVRQFTIDSTTLTINAPIGDSGKGVRLQKAGNGTLVLNANNTFGGGLSVTAGTLQINNTTGSATGPGDVIINANCTLSGTGIIAGSVTVDGTLAPGNPVGTLTLGQTPTLNGTLKLVINRDATPNCSKLVVLAPGQLSSGNTLVIEKSGSDFTGGEVFDLLDVNGAVSLTLPTLPALNNPDLNWYTGKFAQDGTITVNRKPVAGLPLSVTTRTNTPVDISHAKLKAAATDADGDPLTISNLRAILPAGATAVLKSSVLTYTPPLDVSGPGSFTYTLNDGRGGARDVTVSVDIITGNAVSPNLVYGPIKEAGQFVVRFAGIPGSVYTIETSAAPNGPWTKKENQTAPTDNHLGFGVGVFELRETTSESSRYFRTVSPAY